MSVGERERETELLTFSSPRLFQRRGGVVGDIDVASIQKLVRERERGWEGERERERERERKREGEGRVYQSEGVRCGRV